MECGRASWNEESFWATIGSITSLKHLFISGDPIYRLGNWQSEGFIDSIFIQGVAALGQLEHLSINNSGTLRDITPLSNLSNLKVLDLSGCDNVKSIVCLENCVSLQSLEFDSRWIVSIRGLRNLKYIRSISTFSHLDCIDVLANSAFLRRDCQKIFSSFEEWYKAALPITALEHTEGGGINFEHPLEFREKLATSLASALSICGPTPFEGFLEGFLSGNPDISPEPWKAWYAGILTHGGFAMYKRRVEIVSVEKIGASAVGAICATLPYVDEAEWSRAWLKSLEQARMRDSRALLPVAAEICLACARLGESQQLQSWLESFTDPSDSEALDRVHSAFAEMYIRDNKLECAEDHISKIHNSRLSDDMQSVLIKKLLVLGNPKDVVTASKKLLLISSRQKKEALIPLFLESPNIKDESVNNLFIAVEFDSLVVGSIITTLSETSENTPNTECSSPCNSRLLQDFSERIRNSRPETLKHAASKLRELADKIETDIQPNKITH
jgi:hypothetical protein